jgi:hypothetical protein
VVFVAESASSPFTSLPILVLLLLSLPILVLFSTFPPPFPPILVFSSGCCCHQTLRIHETFHDMGRFCRIPCHVHSLVECLEFVCVVCDQVP